MVEFVIDIHISDVGRYILGLGLHRDIKLGLSKGTLKLFRHDYINNHTLLELILECPRVPKIAQPILIWIKDWAYH